MNKLQRWSYKKIIFRLELICEETGVQLFQVNPENTSRTCINCRAIDAKSHKGEIFKCVECGWTADTNYVMAMSGKDDV